MICKAQVSKEQMRDFIVLTISAFAMYKNVCCTIQEDVSTITVCTYNELQGDIILLLIELLHCVFVGDSTSCQPTNGRDRVHSYYRNRNANFVINPGLCGYKHRQLYPD